MWHAMIYVYREEDVLDSSENNGERRLSSRFRSKRRRIHISETRWRNPVHGHLEEMTQG